MTHPNRPPHHAPPAPRNGFGVTALVLGIIGLLLSFLPIIGLLAWPLVVLGLVFAALGFARARQGTATNTGTAVAGGILSLLGLVVCIAWAGAAAAAVADLAPSRPVVNPAAAGSAPSGAFPGQTSGDTVAAPGDQVTVGDLTVTAQPLTAAQLPFSDGPAACSTVTYRNTGSASGPFNLFDWQMQSTAGTVVTPAFGTDDSALGSGQLVPGGEVSGQVCFEGRAGTGSVLLYTANVFTGGRVAFVN